MKDVYSANYQSHTQTDLRRATHNYLNWLSSTAICYGGGPREDEGYDELYEHLMGICDFDNAHDGIFYEN